MRVLTTASVALLLCAVHAHGQGGRTSAVHCYSVTLAPWRPANDLGEDAIFVQPPRRIRVETTRDTSLLVAKGSTAYFVYALDAPPVHKSGSWQVISADSVKLVFSTGYSGLAISLHRQGSAFVGTAETFWDFPRARQTAAATLHEYPCQKATAG